MNRKVVTVIGATGALGLKIAKAVMDQGAHVRAMVRATSNRTDFVTATRWSSR